MGLLDKIKSEAKKSGSNKGKILYIRDGEKKRVRFLNDMDEGMELTFHDSFEKGVNVPCQEAFGRVCNYCDDEDLRTRSMYIWSVWDYEAKEVKLFMYAVNNCSPIPALIALYESYGTLTDRDYVISVTGKQQNKTFSVVPMDKVKFRNEKAKPLSEKAVLKIIDKAYPADDADDYEDDDDYEETKPKKSKSSKPSMPSKSKLVEDELEDEETSSEYEDMSPKELYKLCKERDIEVEPKKPAKYYINLLEEDDKAHDDWDDEDEDYDEDDEWEDDDE